MNGRGLKKQSPVRTCSIQGYRDAKVDHEVLGASRPARQFAEFESTLKWDSRRRVLQKFRRDSRLRQQTINGCAHGFELSRVRTEKCYPGHRDRTIDSVWNHGCGLKSGIV